MAVITSLRELSHKAESLLLILHKEYLNRRKAGISKSEAFSIGDINYICENLVFDLSCEAVEEAINELYNNNLIFKNLWGYIALKNEFLNFCEKNHINM